MAKKRKKSSDSGVALGILFAMLIGGMMIIDKNIAILVVMGILPTVILVFTGGGAWHSYRVQTVGALNVAGIAPYVKQLFVNPYMFDSVITDALTWLIMYGSASVGYMLLYVGPFVASIMIQTMNNQKTQSLIKQRQSLAEEWGSEVLSANEEPKKQSFIQPRRK